VAQPRNAAAHEGALGRQAQVLGRGAGGDDERVGRCTGPLSPSEQNGRCAQVHRIDVVEHDLGFEALGVFQKALHQFRALHALHVGGPVVDIGGRHQLAALGDAGDQHAACRLARAAYTAAV